MTKIKFLGVFACVSDKFGLDVGGMSILFIAAVILGFGSPLLIYFVMYLLKPSEY